MSDHATFLVRELFPDLPADFRRGSLLIEHLTPDRIAQASTAVALYLRDGGLNVAEVAEIDDPREYGVFPVDAAADLFDLSATLAVTCGFEVDRVFTRSFLAVMTNDMARALARDGRVRSSIRTRSARVLQPRIDTRRGRDPSHSFRPPALLAKYVWEWREQISLLRCLYIQREGTWGRSGLGPADETIG